MGLFNRRHDEEPKVSARPPIPEQVPVGYASMTEWIQEQTFENGYMYSLEEVIASVDERLTRIERGE